MTLIEFFDFFFQKCDLKTKTIGVRSGIRTHAWKPRLRPERSALDRSAILTERSQGIR